MGMENQDGYKPASMEKVVSFMAALSVAIKNEKLADMCMLELLALAAFGPRERKVWS